MIGKLLTNLALAAVHPHVTVDVYNERVHIGFFGGQLDLDHDSITATVNDVAFALTAHPSLSPGIVFARYIGRLGVHVVSLSQERKQYAEDTDARRAAAN